MRRKNRDAEQDACSEPDDNLRLLKRLEITVNSIESEYDSVSIESYPDPKPERVSPGTEVLFTDEQLMELVEQAQKGDLKDRRAAFKQLFNYSEPLTKRLSWRWKSCELEDLMQLGKIGMLQAINNFDRTRITCFSGYATTCIKNFISESVVNYEGSIRMPSYVSKKLRKITKSARNLELTLGRKPTLAEIARDTKLERQVVQKLSDLAAREVISLESLFPDEEPSPTETEGLVADSLREPDSIAEDDERREFIAELFRTLVPRDREILFLRFGFGGEDPMTLDEIGVRLRLTRERIRQIQKRAIQKLKSGFSDDAKEFLDCLD